eukprot:GHVN01098580.1.p1 GENE.GHVN01098580.1~~GHVN01098580.1.p1  ORF type:complete len:137 (-),score=38.08 GHVN01098580.1:59-469(-)
MSLRWNLSSGVKADITHLTRQTSLISLTRPHSPHSPDVTRLTHQTSLTPFKHLFRGPLTLQTPCSDITCNHFIDTSMNSHLTLMSLSLNLNELAIGTLTRCCNLLSFTQQTSCPPAAAIWAPFTLSFTSPTNTALT